MQQPISFTPFVSFKTTVPFTVGVAALVLLFSAFAARAQDYVLDGYFSMAGGPTVPYQLAFREYNGQIKGYSLSWFTAGAKPLKAKIAGTLDRSHQQLWFRESPLGTETGEPGASMCYAVCSLSYKRKGGSYVATGVFTASEPDGTPCAGGSVRLTHPAAHDSVLGNYALPPVAPTPHEPVTINVGLISAGSDKEIGWKDDSCFLFVWQYQAGDTDAVTLTVNGKELVNNYTLTANRRKFTVPLSTTTTDICITPTNQGSHPPNRARLMLAGSSTQYLFTAYNEKGRAAHIYIRKNK